MIIKPSCPQRGNQTLTQHGPSNRGQASDASTPVLGDWYATVLPWRPPLVALFVSQATLLPVLVPLAPAVSVLDRFPTHLGNALVGIGAVDALVEAEVAGSRPARVATTASRTVLGSMNEFALLADLHRCDVAELDLVRLSLLLASTPCGPLFRRHVSPERETIAHLAAG